MSAAHNRIFAYGNLRHGFCLAVLPYGLVVLELGRVLEDFCFAPRLVKTAQEPRVNIHGDLSLPMGIETVRPILRDPVRRNQGRIVADNAQVEARRIEITVGTDVGLMHVRQKLAPFDGTGYHSSFDKPSLHCGRDVIEVEFHHACQHFVEKSLRPRGAAHRREINFDLRVLLIEPLEDQRSFLRRQTAADAYLALFGGQLHNLVEGFADIGGLGKSRAAEKQDANNDDGRNDRWHTQPELFSHGISSLILSFFLGLSSLKISR
jgi:hypothetical protein